MKKFTLITSWFFYLRSYKRLVSFRKWLSSVHRKKTNNGTIPHTFHILRNLLFKTNLNKFLWFGINFFSAKNFGLAETGGYLKLYYSSSMPIAPILTSFFFLDKYMFFKNRLSLAASFFNWSSGVTKAINLPTVLRTKKNILPFVAKNLFKRKFLTNKFLSFLRQKKFFKRRPFKFKFGRPNYKFLGTTFSRKYFKFFFYQRYLNWIVGDKSTKNYSYLNNNLLKSFYIKTLASQFASQYSTLESFPNKQYYRKFPRKRKLFVKKHKIYLCYKIHKLQQKYWLLRQQYLKFCQRYFRFNLPGIIPKKNLNQITKYTKLNRKFFSLISKFFKKNLKVLNLPLRSYKEFSDSNYRKKKKYAIFDKVWFEQNLNFNKEYIEKSKQLLAKNRLVLQSYKHALVFEKEKLNKKKKSNKKKKYESTYKLKQKFAKSNFITLNSFREKFKVIKLKSFWNKLKLDFIKKIFKLKILIFRSFVKHSFLLYKFPFNKFNQKLLLKNKKSWKRSFILFLKKRIRKWVKSHFFEQFQSSKQLKELKKLRKLKKLMRLKYLGKIKVKKIIRRFKKLKRLRFFKKWKNIIKNQLLKESNKFKQYEILHKLKRFIRLKRILLLKNLKKPYIKSDIMFKRWIHSKKFKKFKWLKKWKGDWNRVRNILWRQFDFFLRRNTKFMLLYAYRSPRRLFKLWDTFTFIQKVYWRSQFKFNFRKPILYNLNINGLPKKKLDIYHWIFFKSYNYRNLKIWINYTTIYLYIFIFTKICLPKWKYVKFKQKSMRRQKRKLIFYKWFM